ncbi:MAG TPA: PAS domain S-box protein [Desulfobacteraceae bacterium]|nr:PAS domain S-box protein [Desulfobacteraceae bacterium]
MIKDDKLSDVLGTLHKLTSAIFSDAIQRKLILDNLTEAVFTVDKEVKITSFNKAAESITGIAEKDALGKKCTELFESSREDDFCIICQVLQQKRPLTKQTRQLEVGERLIPVMVSASPLTDNSGEMVGGVQSFQEIQEIFQRQLVMDSAFDGVVTVDLEFNITLFNKAAEQLTGYSQDAVLGKPFDEIFYSPEQRLAMGATPLKQAVQTGHPVVEESIYFKTASGDILPVSVRAAPLVDARGTLLGGVKSFRDNTDRIQTNLILDHIVDGVFTTDKRGMINSFNRAAVEITGYPQEEVLGRLCHELFASDSCQERMKQLEGQQVKLEPMIEKNLYLNVRDGRIVPVSMSSVPLLDSQGNLIGTVQTFRDVTHQIQHRYILDSVTDGVFTVDQNLNITSFNKALEKISGYTQEEALGKKCQEIFKSELCGTENCPMLQAISSGGMPAVHNTTLQSKTGSSIPVNVISNVLTDEEGNVIGGVETIRDLTEITELRRKLASSGEPQKGILTRSPKMQRIMSVLPEFSKSDATILVLGESGTGKELIAQSIHSQSHRSDHAFVAVNSGALPDNLLESELFGYKAGAFTDARKDRKGRFAAAEKGTLFLDEIGDISPAMQVKLLRVIQSKTYEPLGSNQPVKTDVRIIAATNRNLEAMVSEGTFREDLYYRLNVVKIELPPLRERMEDIPLLVEHFINKFNQQRDRHVDGVSEAVLSILIHHDYPGNIRELENIIEYAFILCHEGLILPQHLPEWLTGGKEEDHSVTGPLTLKDVERKAIIESLRRNEYKKMKTCRELGISKDTLRRKIAAYDISDNELLDQ